MSKNTYHSSKIGRNSTKLRCTARRENLLRWLLRFSLPRNRFSEHPWQAKACPKKWDETACPSKNQHFFPWKGNMCKGKFIFRPSIFKEYASFRGVMVTIFWVGNWREWFLFRILFFCVKAFCLQCLSRMWFWGNFLTSGCDGFLPLIVPKFDCAGRSITLLRVRKSWKPPTTGWNLAKPPLLLCFKGNSNRPWKEHTPRPSTTCLWRKSFHIGILGGTWGMFQGHVGLFGLILQSKSESISPRPQNEKNIFAMLFASVGGVRGTFSKLNFSSVS